MRRFRRSENVPAAHFQPEARGRYRTQSVVVPKRRVCEAKPPQTVKSSYPHQIRKSRFGGSFLILQVILRGLEPGKVSAFGKCAGGTFSAGRARAVPRAAWRFLSGKSASAAPQTVKSSYPHQKTVHTFVWAVFCKNCLTFICYFFHNFSFLLLQNGFYWTIIKI